MTLAADRNQGAVWPSRVGGLSAYLAMVAAAVILFLLIDRASNGLEAPATVAVHTNPASGKEKSNVLVHVLVTLVAVVVAGQVLGRLFRYVGQPPVIGEVVAGIMLGPSLLGRV